MPVLKRSSPLRGGSTPKVAALVLISSNIWFGKFINVSIVGDAVIVSQLVNDDLAQKGNAWKYSGMS
jgi:hypothetical protein